MKKSTKIIALIMVLALVAAIFAVAAFAEGTEESTEVEKVPGTYIKILGSFDPTDEKWGGAYAGMTYGIWSNERAFKAGIEPDYWYQNTDSTAANYAETLTSENIATTDGTNYKAEYTSAGYVPYYVHIFKDINTQSTQIYPGTAQVLIIDLGGHTLTMKNGFRIGVNSVAAYPNASLTIKNGSVIHEGGQLQFRPDSSFIVENVHWTMTAENKQSGMCSLSQADVIRYTDCYLDIRKGVPFLLGYQTLAQGEARSSLVFENTDIVYADGITVPVLFDLAEGNNAKFGTLWDISFDKDSSITATGITQWFRYKERAYKQSGSYVGISNRSTINFEPGFTLSAGLAKPTTYQLIPFDVAASNTAASEIWKVEETKNIGSGTNLTVTEIAAEPEAVETVGVYSAPEGAWNPLAADNAGKYPGITYATWETEQDFLDGKNPVAWYQDLVKTADNYRVAFMTDKVKTGTSYTYYDADFKDIGYVHCFEDVVNNPSLTHGTGGRNTLDNGTYLIINLGGNTLTDSYAWTVNKSSGGYPNSLFMIKNGTLIRDSGSKNPTYCRQDGTVIFQNVIYDASGFLGNTVFEDVGSELFVFEDSKLILNEKAQISLNANWKNPLNNYLIFKNTDLIQRGNPTVPLFTLLQYANIERECNWSIVFDKDSSVTRSNSNWIKLDSTQRDFKYTQGLYFEVGCQISPEAMPGYDMTYILNGEEANANTSGKHFEIAVINPVQGGIQYTLPTSTAIPTVSGMNAPINRAPGAFDTASFNTKVKAEIYCSKTGWVLEDVEGTQLKLLVALEGWKPTSDTTYGVWENEESFLAGLTPMFSATAAELLTENIATLGDGVTYKTEYAGKIPGYVVLYASVENKSSAIYLGNTQNLIIDLNGFAITSTAGITLGNSAAESKSTTLTLLGGTINQVDGAISVPCGTSLTFDGVTLNVSKTGKQAVLAASAGDVLFNECTVNLERNNASFDLAGGNLVFASTSISQLDTPTSPLFWVEKENAEISVLLDKNSSVVRNSKLYVGIALSTEETVSLKLYFEDGIDVSDGAVPDFTYLYSLAPTVAGSMIHTSAESSSCDIAVVSSNLMSKSTDPYFIIGNGTLQLIASIDNYCAAEIDPTDPKRFYQLWMDALDSGGATTPFTTRNGAIIHLFRDTELKYGGTYQDYDLTIDLKGHKLYSKTKTSIQLGINQSAGWGSGREINFISSDGRGTLALSRSSFQVRPGTNVYFQNIDIVDLTGHLFHDGGAQLIHFKNCNISGSGDAAYIVNLTGMSGKADQHERRIVLDSSNVTGVGFAKIDCNVADYTGHSFIVMNGSGIDNSKPLIKVNEPGTGTAVPESMITRNLFIDMDTEFTCASTDFSDISVVAGMYHTVKTQYYKDITDYKSLGNHEDEKNLIFVGDGAYFKVIDEREIDLSALSYSYAAPGSIKVAVATVLDPDGNAYVTFDKINSLPNETVITLYRDVLLKEIDGGACNGGYVFDLGGNTLTFMESFTVSGTELTFKNGAIAAPDASGTLFLFADGSLPALLLDGITLTVGENVTALFAMNGGSLTVTDSAITAENAAVALLSGEASLTLDGVELKADSLITVNYTVGTKLTVAVTESELELVGALVSALAASDIYGGVSDDYVNLSISESYVIATELVDSASDAMTAPLVHFTLSETFFSCEPVTDAGMADVTLARGERAMPITGFDGYTWHVTLFDVKLKASIFIESDFGIKFYIPADTNITAITIAGIPYTVADITDTEVYDGKSYKFIIITSILPTDAAEVIDMTVVFDKDGASHTEETGYSVLGYFKTLLKGDMTVKLKQLGAATVDYIYAAYCYANKTNEELDALMASEQYALYKGETFVAESTSDTSALAGVIESAQFELGNAVKFRFNLAPGYTGTLTVNGREFEIENGTYNGADYISISLPAFEICRELTVACDGAVCNYSVEAYATAIKNSTDPNVTPEMKTLVAAFYNYCRYAEAFRAIYEN